MVIRVVSWNLFHGRDSAPDPELHTWRSRLLRGTERGASHAQVNRDLFDAFAAVLDDAEWDIALLQECPPRWAEGLATACGAEPHLVPTARNLGGPLTTLQSLAGRLNPDLIASWGGGCNLTLVRGRRNLGRTLSDRRQVTLTRRPETRRMALSRLRSGLCVANLHASGARRSAEAELETAARVAVDWAAGGPLLFGGDFNVRSSSSATLFATLTRDYGFTGPVLEGSVDHLLARGVTLLDETTRWPPTSREVPDPTAPDPATALPIRLSDHAPIEATFELPEPG
jgi:endonuclease/exonuclease/phosphatase family metal-dependent hydrolase